MLLLSDGVLSEAVNLLGELGKHLRNKNICEAPAKPGLSLILTKTFLIETDMNSVPSLINHINSIYFFSGGK